MASRYDTDKFGTDIQADLQKCDYVEFEKKDFERSGLEINSHEYCDWLTKYKLRQQMGRKFIAFTKQV